MDKEANKRAKLWTLHFTELMWEEGQKLWKERCDKTHEKIGRDDTSRRRERIEIKVQAIYERAEEISHRDRHKILRKTLEDKLQETTRQLERWHANVAPAFKQALHDATKRLQAETHDIRTFFEQSTKIPETVAIQKKRRKRPRLGRLVIVQEEETESEASSEIKIPKQMHQQHIPFGTRPTIGLQTTGRKARIPPALQKKATQQKTKRMRQNKITHSMASTNANTNHPI